MVLFSIDGMGIAMKKWTGFIAIILILSGILLGCSESDLTDNLLPNRTENQTRVSDSQLPEDLHEIVYMYPWYGTIPSGVSDVEAAINEITIEKIHTRVHLKPVSASTFSQQMSLSLTSREQIDLVTTSNDFTSLLAQNQLMDMTDLIHERGQGILDAVDIFINGTMRNGRIYGVTVMGGMATSSHFLMRTDWLEETGVDVDLIIPVNGIMEMDKNLEIIEEIFAKVKENHPDASILVTNMGDTYLERLIVYDNMGDELGVIMCDSDAGNAQIVNLYATEEFRKAVLLAQRWNDLGYMMKDAAMNTTSSGSVLLGGNAFCDLPITQQGVEAQYKQTTGYDFTAVQMSLPLLYTGQNVTSVNALPVTCSDPEAAMDFLNLMYTDKDIVNLLAYGVEGVHYRFMPNGTVDYPDGVTAQNSEYPCSQTWSFGNALLDYVKVGNVPELYEIQAKGNETARRSVAFGFIYDDTPVRSQVVACQKVVAQYKIGLLTGELDIEMLDEFNRKLEDAGINDIIAEKTRQYEAWKAQQETRGQ